MIILLLFANLIGSNGILRFLCFHFQTPKSISIDNVVCHFTMRLRSDDLKENIKPILYFQKQPP